MPYKLFWKYLMHFIWSCYEPCLRIQACNRGLVPTLSPMALRMNILITKKTSDATSSSSSDFSPVNPIKRLLLWKEKNRNTGAASSTPAKTMLSFTLPQYGLWIRVTVVGGRCIFWSLTPGLAKFSRLVKLTAAMTDGQWKLNSWIKWC